MFGDISSILMNTFIGDENCNTENTGPVEYGKNYDAKSLADKLIVAKLSEAEREHEFKQKKIQLSRAGSSNTGVYEISEGDLAGQRLAQENIRLRQRCRDQQDIINLLQQQNNNLASQYGSTSCNQHNKPTPEVEVKDQKIDMLLDVVKNMKTQIDEVNKAAAKTNKQAEVSRCDPKHLLRLTK